MILETLRNTQLYAMFSKYELHLEKVAFLGRYMSKEGVYVDPAKIQAVSEWPTPKNVLTLGVFGIIWVSYEICERFLEDSKVNDQYDEEGLQKGQ